MKRWGVVTTVLYAFVVIAFLFPGAAFLAELGYRDALSSLFDPSLLIGDGTLIVWLLIGLFVAAQAALLFVSVDARSRRLKPRRHIAVTVAATAFAVGAMSIAIVFNLIVALTADEVFDWGWAWWAVPLCLWAIWGVVFYLYRHGVYARLDRTVGWLLNGSILQLLIAVPTHILVRQRNDCCAPVVSAYGIATGVALMLMAFGPSVFFLYQSRLDGYARKGTMPLLAKWPVRTVVGASLIGSLALLVCLPVHPLQTARGFIEISPGQANALVADVSRLASDLDMQLQTIDRFNRSIQCRGRTVAKLNAVPIEDGRNVGWTYRLFADEFQRNSDYARFAKMVHDLHDDVGGLSEYETENGNGLSRWLVRVRNGSVFGTGCRLPG